jgi:hypothetical protein
MFYPSKYEQNSKIPQEKKKKETPAITSSVQNQAVNPPLKLENVGIKPENAIVCSE